MRFFKISILKFTTWLLVHLRLFLLMNQGGFWHMHEMIAMSNAMIGKRDPFDSISKVLVVAPCETKNAAHDSSTLPECFSIST